MNNYKKINIIILIILFSALLYINNEIKYYSITKDSIPLFEIPIIFWLVLTISPFLLYSLSMGNKNFLIPTIGSILYYFLFYSYGIFFIIHPLFSDLSSSIKGVQFLNKISFVTGKDIYSDLTFEWPIHSIFSKFFSEILGFGPINTINIGFFSILLCLPILIIYYFNKNIDIKESGYKYFIIPTFYLILTFYILNSQFVPQFLALIYLFFLFGIYARYKKNSKNVYLILIIIVFILCVFTHPFMFLFFLITIFIEKFINFRTKKREIITFSWRIILIFTAVIFITYLPYHILKLKEIINSPIGQGGSWNIINSILSNRSPISENIPSYPLYNFIPELYNFLLSNFVKIIIITSLSIAVFGFIIYNYKYKKSFDFSLIITAGIWYCLGLFIPNLLGTRSLQVAFLPLSNFNKKKHIFNKFFSIIIIAFICISPTIFVTNNLINTSITGEELIQDFKENYAGKFIDQNAKADSILINVYNAYPTGNDKNIKIIRLEYFIKSDLKWIDKDLILFSPKFQKQSEYLNISINFLKSNFLYNNANNINIIE